VDDVVETVMGTVVVLGQTVGNLFTGGPAGRWKAATPRDAYSVIFFNNSTKKVIVNDTTSSPNEILNRLLSEPAGGSTDIPAALRAAKAVMEQNWSSERLVTFPNLLCSVPLNVY
jgi:hypothetical protein